MSDTFYVRQGDLLPLLGGVLSDARGPVELTGATVRLHLRDRHTKRVRINAVATVLPDQIADKGRVVYEWVAGDTANAAELEGEWQVTFLSGKRQTFPNHGAFQVDISPQVA